MTPVGVMAEVAAEDWKETKYFHAEESDAEDMSSRAES